MSHTYNIKADTISRALRELPDEYTIRIDLQAGCLPYVLLLDSDGDAITDGVPSESEDLGELVARLVDNE